MGAAASVHQCTVRPRSDLANAHALCVLCRELDVSHVITDRTAWPLSDLDYAHYLPVFFDGLREKHRECRKPAEYSENAYPLSTP